MTPSNRLRWRLTLLYSLASFVSGIVLLVLVVLVSLTLPSDAAAPHTIQEGRVGPPGVAARLPNDNDGYQRDLLLVPGLALLIMLPVSLGGGWILAGRMLRPVRTMNERLERISGRNVHERLSLQG